MVGLSKKITGVKQIRVEIINSYFSLLTNLFTIIFDANTKTHKNMEGSISKDRISTPSLK